MLLVPLLSSAVALGACSTRSLDHLVEGNDATVDGDALEGDGVIFPPEGCGAEGQPCCEGSSCPLGLVCKAARCEKAEPPKPCGNKGEACCGATSTCFSPLVCTGGTCVDPPTPKPPDPCGAEGQGCCAAPSPACGDGLACAGTTCVRCGDAGQPCCGGSCRGKTVCGSGGCAPCGGNGQLCCGGGACDPGTICKGSCVGCGGVGQPCCGLACTGTTACVGGACKQCCALCKNRTAYHRLDFGSMCAEQAATYCNEAGKNRGGLADAKWDYCSP